MESKNEFDFDLFDKEKAPEKERSSPEQKKEKKEKKRKKQRLINLAAVIICAALVAAVLLLAAPFAFAKYNPERYARQYIEAVISDNYAEVYDKSEGRHFADFSKEEFVAACEQNPELLSLADYEITDFSVKKHGEANGDYQEMLVTFTGSEGEIGNYIFRMQRISNGFWKYDEYAAVLSFDIVCSARIYAPAGTSIFLNDEQLINEQSKALTAITADARLAHILNTPFRLCLREATPSKQKINYVPPLRRALK